jgi:tetratricopeptide (TPR) repeat protein
MKSKELKRCKKQIMDCERFEELLIDFMEDEIDPSEREVVKKHLVTCPYCSKRLEEYKKIRRIFNGETLPELSSQVLASLSKIAREEVAKDKPLFWKRWFYSPILVPVLSSALALFLWIYYGQKNIEHSPGESILSREVMAKKVPAAKEPALPGVGEKTLEKLESKPGHVLSKPSSVSPPALKEKSRIQEEATSSSGSLSKELVARKGVKESDQFSENEEKSLGKLERPTEEAPTQKEESKKAELYSYQESNKYQKQLDLALKQQREGNCEVSIKTNEELLKASPSPPDSLKEKAYLSLAECYEQKGDWEKAILNYRNLQEVSPDKASFAEHRIQDLRQRLILLKTRESRPADAEEGQKTK